MEGLSPEIRFLLALLREESGGSSPRPAADISWPLFLTAARHHRAALWMEPAAAPDTVRSELVRLRRQTLARTLAVNAELGKLGAAFQDAGIAMLALKGPAVAKLLHGDPCRRPTRDIDLLVRPEGEAAALTILARHGYGATAATVCRHDNALELHNPDMPFPVELHTRLSEDDRLFPMAAFNPFETAVTVEIAGTPIRTLPPAAAVAFAAYHGARHFWSRLFWLTDIAKATACPAVSWSEVDEVARRTGTERHLALALRLSSAFLGCGRPDRAPFPPPLSAPARAAVRRFEAAMPVVLALPPCLPLHTVRRIGRLRSLGLEFGLFRRWPARLAILRSRAAPTDTDRARIRLPPSLGFLYYPIRLLRVLRLAIGARG